MSLLWKPFSKSLRVLNRLNSNGGDKDDTVNQDRIRSVASNHEQVQQRIFTKWINMQLEHAGIRINSVERDLRDGHVLHALLRQLTQTAIKDIDRRNTRFHHLSNVSICLQFLERSLGELPNIGSIDIVDGNLKLTLGLLWLIILRFQIQQVIISDEEGSLPNSPDSIPPSPGSPPYSSIDTLSRAEHNSSTASLIAKSAGKGGDPKKFLLDWVQGQLRSYEGLIPQVRDFSCSWQSGLAFAALIHRHDSKLVPSLGDMVERGSRDRDEWRDILDTSFKVAKEGMGVPSLLEPDDILSISIPDEKVIMMYVSEFYKVMSAKQAQDAAQETLKFEALVAQFKQLAAAVTCQVEKFQAAFDTVPPDYFNVSPLQLEELATTQHQRKHSVKAYEPTVQTLGSSAASILAAPSNLAAELGASVQKTRDQVLAKWEGLQEILAESERKLDEVRRWGELNLCISQLDERMKDLSSLCSDFMELKGTWSDVEKLDRLDALKEATHQGDEQHRELQAMAGDSAPPSLQRRLQRCGELLRIAKLNIEQFQIGFEINELIQFLSDALLKLVQKRAELRKLTKASAWTPERVAWEEIQVQRDDQLRWKQTIGDKLMAEVRARCTATRLTVEGSTCKQSAQIQPALLKEEEVMFSWQEIERLLYVQELLVKQSAEVEALMSKVLTLTQTVDQLQEEFDAQAFGEDFDARVDRGLDDVERLHGERQQLSFPRLPETMESDDFIANHTLHALDVQTQRLMALRRGRKAHEEDGLLFELYSGVQREGDELVTSAAQHAAWIEDNLKLFAKVSHEDASPLIGQISAKREELEAQNARLDEQRRALSQRIESLLPQLKLKSQADQLQALQSQLDAQQGLAETLIFKLVEVLEVGPHLQSRIAFFLELQADLRVLQSEVTSAQLGQTAPEALQSWAEQLQSLTKTRSADKASDAASSHLTQLNHELNAAIQAVDDAIDQVAQALAALEAHVQNHPFQEFSEMADDFMSASVSLGEITQKTLSTYQLKRTDDSQVMAAKLAALSTFVASLQEKANTLQTKRTSLDARLKHLQEQPSSPNLSASISKSTEAETSWVENAAIIAAAPIIHQQVQELITRFSQLHQVDATLQQTRSDIVDLLNFAGDSLDAQVKVLEEMLAKIAHLLGRVSDYHSPALPTRTPSEICHILDANHLELKELIRQMEANLSATRLLFATNREKAEDRAKAAHRAHWEAWCRQQGDLLEEEQRFLRLTLWKDANAAGMELFDRAQAARLQLQDKVAQYRTQFESTLVSPSAEAETRAAFEALDSAIALQLSAIPKAKALSTHWALVLQAQRWISHHKNMLDTRPLNPIDSDAVQAALEDPHSELRLAYAAYLASVPTFTQLCDSLSANEDCVFLFVDPVRLQELIQASHAVSAEWEQLQRLRDEARDLLQASDMWRAIHASIESLHAKVRRIEVTGQLKQAELAHQQLAAIDCEVKDQVLTQVRQWQSLAFSLPRDNAGWSDKVRQTGESIDLLVSAIEDKRRQLAAHQDQCRLLALCDQIDHSIGKYLSVIDAIAKEVDKSSTFLADLEKALVRLAEAESTAAAFVEAGFDELEGAPNLGDWRLDGRVQVLPAQWEEVQRMGLDLQAKLAKRIEYKQGAVQAQALKKIQRAKSRAPIKYVPPNKDAIKSRYMGPTEKKDEEPAKPKPSPNTYVADMKDTLDVEVARVVNSYPQMVKVTRDVKSGRYWIGDRDPKLCFCRVLRSNLVMVRVGGGWTELTKYLADHAVDSLDCRSSSRSRAGSSLGTSSPSRDPTANLVGTWPGRVLSPLSEQSAPRSGLRPVAPNPSDGAYKRTATSIGKLRPVSRCASPTILGASANDSTPPRSASSLKLGP